jgi:hypothetical protein
MDKGVLLINTLTLAAGRQTLEEEMKEKSKTKFTQTRWFIFLVTYLVLVLPAVGMLIDPYDETPYMIGDYLTLSGTLVVTLGFILLSRDNTWFKPLIVYQEGRYLRRKNHSRPYTRVIVTVILAGAAVFISGYLWLQLFPY